MRFLSLHVRNYRIHRELRLEFDPARNLIGGPNESGKSTLAEAAHRALFTNHRWGGKLQESMCSRHSSEPPEVHLTFLIGDRKYSLTKVFNAPKGRAELRNDRHEQWTGNDAEVKLAELLGNQGLASKKEAGTQWSHLWIWQGSSAEDPSASTTSQKDKLTARLQQEGGAAVLQSDRDSRVANKFLDQADSLFNQNGSTKAQSPQAHAEQARERALARLNHAQTHATQLEQAMHEHRSATDCLAQASRALPELEAQQAECLKSLSRATQLEEQQKEAKRALDEFQLTLQTLEKTDSRIGSLEEAIDRRTHELTPFEKDAEALSRQLEFAEDKRQQAVEAADQAAQQLRDARATLDLVRGHRQLLEYLHTEEKLQRRLQNAKTLEQQILPLQARLAELPEITQHDLDDLRQRINRRDQAHAALDAIATGIELVEGSRDTQLDALPLERGERRTISAVGTLEVAGTTIRIYPGGGRNLEAQQEALKQQEEAVASAFRKFNVNSIQEAAAHLTLREDLTRELKSLRQRLGSLEPAETKAELRRLASQRTAIETQLMGRHQPPGEIPMPQSLEELAPVENSARKAEEKVSQAEQEALLTRKSVETDCTRLRQNWEQANDGLKTKRQDLAEAQTRYQTLVEEHGSRADRRTRLDDLKKKVTTASEAFEKIRRQLTALQPEHLKQDEVRLRRSIEQQKARQATAREALAAARASLRSDGSNDPHSERIEAQEQLQVAEEELQSARRRALATQRLADLFREERQGLADRFTVPLSAKVGDYLQCLFGREAIADLKLEDGRFDHLNVARPLGQFEFAKLSGGTKEQVAAAMRLAVAELLAAEHHGSLPVVFDDSFTHSDPERVLKLQRMLDLAASRGLQIIVLTCTPHNYRSLGAHEIHLPPSSTS
ncbi:MAG: AAA family ATPase [Verrucomicrobiales bacterium]